MQKQLTKSETLGLMKFLKIKNLPFVVPLLIFLMYCFAFLVLLKNGSFSVDNLLSILKRKDIIKSINYSFCIVTLSTAISIVLGTTFAISLANSKTMLSKACISLLSGVLYMPHFIMAFYVYEILSDSNFVFSKIGIPIILSYVLKQTPFVFFYIFPIILKIPKEQQEAVKLMGANRWLSFKTVFLPRLIPLYAEITIILVSFILTAYETPYLLGITFPKFLGVILYNFYFRFSETDKQEAVALMLLITFVLFALGFILFLFSNKLRISLYRNEKLH